MIRHLCPPPSGPWTPDALVLVAKEAWPSTIAVNEVEGQVAVYFPDDDAPPSFEGWDSFVAEWEEPPVAAPQDPAVLAAEVMQEKVTENLSPGSVNSIAEVKSAIITAMSEAVQVLRGD